tara:strand:- start:3463 stop:3576 length:114 start_codon:yes stop_codon:yes gene_type:complete
MGKTMGSASAVKTTYVRDTGAAKIKRAAKKKRRKRKK